MVPDTFTRDCPVALGGRNAGACQRTHFEAFMKTRCSPPNWHAGTRVLAHAQISPVHIEARCEAVQRHIHLHGSAAHNLRAERRGFRGRSRVLHNVLCPRRAGRGASPRMRTAWRLAPPAKAGRAAARAGGSGADARMTRRRRRRQKRRLSASRVTLRADHAPDIGCSGSPSRRTAPRPPTRRRRARRCVPRAGAAARRATAPLARDASAASRHVRARRSARHAARCSRAAAATAARRRTTRGRVGFSFVLSECLFAC